MFFLKESNLLVALGCFWYIVECSALTSMPQFRRLIEFVKWELNQQQGQLRIKCCESLLFPWSPVDIP